jgi:CheY-like chemotaxis protein
VQNGQEALEAVQTDWPDVVFFDLAMPGVDGYEVAKRIRAMAGAKNCTWMAAITGNDRPEHRERSLAEGLDEHFVKPTDPDMLVEWLSRVAGDSGQHPRLGGHHLHGRQLGANSELNGKDTPQPKR